MTRLRSALSRTRQEAVRLRRRGPADAVYLCSSARLGREEQASEIGVCLDEASWLGADTEQNCEQAPGFVHDSQCVLSFACSSDFVFKFCDL